MTKPTATYGNNTRFHDDIGRIFQHYTHNCWVELASRADCGDREDEWVRDMFTAHISNEKLQKNCWHKHVAHRKHTNIRYDEKRNKTQSHHEKNPFGGQIAITKQEPVDNVNARGRRSQQNNQNNQRGRGGFRGRPYPRGSQNTRGQQQQRNTNSRQCYKCGNQYGSNHLQSKPVKDKICSKCAKRGHFAKVCRSTNVNYLGDTNEEQQEETELENTETDNDLIAYAEFTTNNGWEESQIDKFSVMAIVESFEIKNTKTLSEDDLYWHIVKLKTNATELFANAESGSTMSFLNEKTAHEIQQNNQTAGLTNISPEDTARNLACYNRESKQPKGRLIFTIELGGWKIQTSPFIITDDHKTNIIGRNLLPRIGIQLIQEKQTHKVLNL